jgi:hypothetical protein
LSGGRSPGPIPKRRRHRACEAEHAEAGPAGKQATRHTQSWANHTKRRSVGAGTRANRAAPVSLTR